jgi:hypothetical protein
MTIGMVEVARLAASGAERSTCHNDIDLEPDEVRRQLRQPFEPILRIAALEHDVFPFHPSQLPQVFAHHTSSRISRRTRAEAAYDILLPALLRTGRERPCRRHASETGDEVAPPHGLPQADDNSLAQASDEADVRYGSGTDIEARPVDVRFTPKSGHLFCNSL